ncbi:phosphoenolpyruvate carboxykinase (GTP) [Candidatus Woesearchaeota archaeon]|nr:phosphoenolpyruvate carboxykinase (GTP) [Candidatus Woesearchaeota archaeon]
MNIDKNVLDEKNLAKLEALKNPKAMKIIEKYVNLCKPAKVTVLTDSQDDIDYLRKGSIKNKEETPLAMEGHTIHYDGVNDQARAKEVTKVLLPKGKYMSKFINTIDKEEGLKEVHEFMDGIMEGKEMLVCLFTLGPNNSRFSIPALQLTDSYYVAHSESILYRSGYEDFKQLNGSEDFFYFIHSAGQLDERNNTVNIDKRRVYMDLEENRVLTVNNQYAGNSVGLKKLALRLAINKASQEDWLCEHMFVMGVHPLSKDRVTYFTGAFPSACGKTATAMISGQTIVGDDIAYIKAGDDGVAYSVNVEQGIFGIIRDINQTDDPVIHKALSTPRELIFSNVLVVDGKPYWLGMGQEPPEKGYTYCGEWKKSMKDKDGNEIPYANKNARYTIRINDLDNADPEADNPEGVPIGGFIYGGRDSDTTIPVFESLSWSHGVYVGAIVESETTAATLGAEGVRKHNPMANLDFLVVPLGLYIKNHLAFGETLDKNPKIFHTNYFLKENGEFLNSKLDKKVWLLWMEGRVHNEYSAIETPIGFIPKYEDLKKLFLDVFKREYTKEEYEKQFSIRITKLLEKLARVEKVFEQEKDIPKDFIDHFEQEKKRLKEAKEKFGKEVISPSEFQ